MLSRQQGADRADRRILRASRRLTLVRAERRVRPALPLSRLEIRRDRAMRRSSVGAGGIGLPQEHQAEILSLHREGGHRVGLYGAACLAAAAARARMDRRRAAATLRFQAPAGVQLPAGDGRRHRFKPCVVAARQRAQQGSAVQGLEGQCLQRTGSHAAVRGRGISRRLADRRAAQRRGREVLLAHHAMDHALVFDHSAARRAIRWVRTRGYRSTTRTAGPGASTIIPSAR